MYDLNCIIKFYAVSYLVFFKFLINNFFPVCNFVVHERCSKTVISPCSSVASSLVKVNYSRTNCDVFNALGSRTQSDTVGPKHSIRSENFATFAENDSTIATPFIVKVRETQQPAFHTKSMVYFAISLPVLCSCGVPGFCGTRLQRKRHLHSRKRVGTSATHASLARGKSSKWQQMRAL